MKVAISVATAEVNASLHSRFGRAVAFVFVNTDTNTREVLPNPAQQASGGAGVSAAEFLVKQKVDAVISQAVGPKAANVLSAAKINMYQANSGTTVDELLEQFLQGSLELIKES